MPAVLVDPGSGVVVVEVDGGGAVEDGVEAMVVCRVCSPGRLASLGGCCELDLDLALAK